MPQLSVAQYYGCCGADIHASNVITIRPGPGRPLEISKATFLLSLTLAPLYMRSHSLVAFERSINDFGPREVHRKRRNLHSQSTATWPAITSSYIAPDSD